VGKRGPAKTPTSILGARGSWRAKGRGGEPEALGLPERPDWLDPTAVKVWEQLLPLLVKQQCAAEIDAAMLGMLCHHYSAFLRAKKVYDVADPASPEWKRLHDAINTSTAHIEKLSQRFGLTPADRAGIKIQDAAPEKTDAARFFAENAN
jgi:P27 family predicted phage terminase small subunit